MYFSDAEDSAVAEKADDHAGHEHADGGHDAHDGDHDHEHAEDGHGEHGHDEHGHASAEHDAHTEGDHGTHSDGAHGDHAVTEFVAAPMTEQLGHNMKKHLDVNGLMGHVQDSTYIELPESFGVGFTDDSGHRHSGVQVPGITGFTKETPMIGTAESPLFVGRFTKFMALELAAAIVIAVVFIWLGRKMKDGDAPKGKIWNLLETFVVYIRDEVVRPAVGEHDSERFLPFLLTLFFFILTLNLFGAIPYLGAATGSLAVTGVLALVTFGVVAGSGIQKMGFTGFLKAQVPSMDLPPLIKMFLLPLMFVIEIFGFLVKHAVLAIRLFANMFAGHLVLAIFVGFIGVVSGTILMWAIAPVVVGATIAFSAMELFVAFLQAYVFTFLASLFVGSAQHAH